MADKRDYYEVLGVQKSASDDEIKRAYRKLAKENHPDLHPGDKDAEERFKEINEAYGVLSDKDKKSKYDQFGFAGVDPNYAAANGGYGGFGDMDFDLGSIFDMFTGGGQSSSRRRNAAQRGESIYVNLDISFEEAAFGCEKEITFSRTETCDVCSGSGCEAGTTPEVCSQCNGTGQIRTQQRTMLGSFTSTSPCSRCGGTGKIIHSPCKNCRGSGFSRKSRKATVKIPAGIDDGQRVQLRGQGHAGKNGGGAGDVLVNVSVRPHKIFERDGTSVICQIPLTFAQAALGCELEVPTLDGRVKYDIPEGTQTGTVFRLRGKGIPYLNGKGRGDQYVTVNIEVPKNMTGEQKELLRKYAEAMGESGERESFFDKIKRKK